MNDIAIIKRNNSVISAKIGLQDWLVHAGFITLTILLPAVSHMLGLPVRWLLPMHWPVIMAGLVYGWRSGLMVGLLAPATNYLLTGYPLPPILPAMTAELAVYGSMVGLVKEYVDSRGYWAVLAALAFGRLTFIGVVAAFGLYGSSYFSYLKAAMLPGFIALSLQTALLPPLAAWWVDKVDDTKEE